MSQSAKGLSLVYQYQLCASERSVLSARSRFLLPVCIAHPSTSVSKLSTPPTRCALPFVAEPIRPAVPFPGGRQEPMDNPAFIGDNSDAYGRGSHFPLGVVLLDVEETNAKAIVSRAVECMVSVDQVPYDQKKFVINSLLADCSQINDSQFQINKPEKESGDDSEHRLPLPVRKAGINKVFSAHSFKKNNKSDDFNTYNPDFGGGQKVPDGAEATAVLVGAVDFLKSPTIAFVRLAEGVMMDNLVNVPLPVRFLFILLGPYHEEKDYQEVGESISTLMADKYFHEVAYHAQSRNELVTAIKEFLSASDNITSAEKASGMHVQKNNGNASAISLDIEPTSVQQRNAPRTPARDPLKREGKLFHGLIQDLKMRMPQYPSDIKDGIAPQVLASAIFIFFASLSPAITFGGMYADKTNLQIGVGETLLVTSINGILLAVCGCQPLLIVGATGPLMVFDLALYGFAESFEMEYLPLRVWIGVWMTVCAALISAFELVFVVKHLTRFTEEIFSTLVCLIFIYGAIEKMVAIFQAHPLQNEYFYEDANHTEIVSGTIVNGTLVNGTNANGVFVDSVGQPQPNTALLSLILMFGTFFIAFKLKRFRNSKYLGRGIRRALGDFGVPISIVLMVLMDYLIHDTYTDKLTMPAGIQPSNPKLRGWFINPFGLETSLPVWAIFACAPASLLLLTLIFIEENICQLILSKPERNMKKGSGFHWDLFLSCSVNIISGLMGAPFMTPAVVRSVSHAAALTIVDSKNPSKATGAYEQRLSAFVVSVLVGLSIFLSDLLNLIPNAVLYGVFLYMGISATAGIQFLERCILFLVPVKHHPKAMPFVKDVATKKMHLFTAIQLTMIVVLWVVKQSPASLCFPFILMILVPIRMYLLPYIWNAKELFALDGGAPPKDDNEELDFYEVSHNLGSERPPPENH
ncbi:Bicarbonate transporter eukaryotic [Trinorchestia longiramus]|nr:Bicarbonate transporter eukaryotic [Trinorchestia longiramus]